MRSFLKGILALVLLGAPLLTLHAQLVSEHLVKAFLRMDILTEQSQLVIASSLREHAATSFRSGRGNTSYSS